MGMVNHIYLNATEGNRGRRAKCQKSFRLEHVHRRYSLGKYEGLLYFLTTL